MRKGLRGRLDKVTAELHKGAPVAKRSGAAGRPFADGKANAALLGPLGVGKTRIALALAVCRAGCWIYCASLDDMIRNLKTAESAGRLVNRVKSPLIGRETICSCLLPQLWEPCRRLRITMAVAQAGTAVRPSRTPLQKFKAAWIVAASRSAWRLPIRKAWTARSGSILFAGYSMPLKSGSIATSRPFSRNWANSASNLAKEAAGALSTPVPWDPRGWQDRTTRTSAGGAAVRQRSLS